MDPNSSSVGVLIILTFVWALVGGIAAMVKCIDSGGIFIKDNGWGLPKTHYNKYQKIFLSICYGPAWILLGPIYLVYLTWLKVKELFDLLGEL